MTSRNQSQRVAQLMSRRVSKINETDTAALAHQVMLWSGVRHLPVMRDGKLVAMVSDRDLLRTGGPDAKPLGETSVQEIQSSSLVTITADTSVDEAARIMVTNQIDGLPVVDGDEIIGILTSTDILAERARLSMPAGSATDPCARQLMRSEPTAVGCDASLQDIVRLMVDEGIRHIPVVDGDGRLVGMVSDRDVRNAVGDLVAALRSDADNGQVVEDIMTENPIAAKPTSALLEMADALLDERVGALPVVDDDDRLIGIVSYVDVLGYLVGRRDRDAVDV